MWCVLLVLLVAAACDGKEEDCSFDAFVERHLLEVQTAGVLDCGQMPVVLGNQLPDDRPWREAQACVRRAITEHVPYVVTWRTAGIEGLFEQALIWAGDGARPTRISRSVNADGSRPPSVRLECEQVVDYGDCSTVVTSLCLDCRGPIIERCGE